MKKYLKKKASIGSTIFNIIEIFSEIIITLVKWENKTALR